MIIFQFHSWQSAGNKNWYTWFSITLSALKWMGLLLFEERLKVDLRSFRMNVFLEEFLLGNGALGPGICTIRFFDILNVIFDAKTTQIGLFSAEICFYTNGIIRTGRLRLVFRFTELFFRSEIQRYNFKIFLKIRNETRSDSDSLITLTIMWGSLGRIEKLFPLVNQWPTRDYTPLHSAALRSVPLRSVTCGSLVHSWK